MEEPTLIDDDPILQFNLDGLPIPKRKGDILEIYIHAKDSEGPVTLKLITTNEDVDRLLKGQLLEGWR